MINYFRDQYIIAFPPGSSGRFVQYLLFNLLSEEKDELLLTPDINSSHPGNRYTGHSGLNNTNHPDIWNLFVFDIKPRRPAPRIMHTHMFPNFGLIKNRLGANVKIIIITVSLDNILEVAINNKVKNYYDLINGIWPKPDIEKEFYDSQVLHLTTQYKKYLGKPYPGMFVHDDIVQLGKCMSFDVMKHLAKKLLNQTPDLDEFLEEKQRLENFVFVPQDIDYPKNQLLFLPYDELFSSDKNGKFIWLKKLEEFTNKQVDAVTLDGYQKYIDGRAKLIEQYRI